MWKISHHEKDAYTVVQILLFSSKKESMDYMTGQTSAHNLTQKNNNMVLRQYNLSVLFEAAFDVFYTLVRKELSVVSIAFLIK